MEDRRQERGDQLPGAKHVHADQGPVSGVGSAGCCWVCEMDPNSQSEKKKKPVVDIHQMFAKAAACGQSSAQVLVSAEE